MNKTNLEAVEDGIGGTQTQVSEAGSAATESSSDNPPEEYASPKPAPTATVGAEPPSMEPTALEPTLSDKAASEQKTSTKPDVKQPDEIQEQQSGGTVSPNQYKDSLTRKPSAARSLRNVMAWSLSSYFDFNPSYLIQFRGIMNVLHAIMSLIVIILLGTSCQLLASNNSATDGFYCKPPETFLFVTACASFFTSLLYFFCCLLSKSTEALLFNTSFEVTYFIMYAILYIISGFSVLISGFRSDIDTEKTSYDYHVTYGAGVIGLLNGIAYGGSAIVFFITHQFQISTRGSLEDLETVSNA